VRYIVFNIRSDNKFNSTQILELSQSNSKEWLQTSLATTLNNA